MDKEKIKLEAAWDKLYKVDIDFHDAIGSLIRIIEKGIDANAIPDCMVYVENKVAKERKWAEKHLESVKQAEDILAARRERVERYR